jgi:hypothetical protein
METQYTDFANIRTNLNRLIDEIGNSGTLRRRAGETDESIIAKLIFAAVLRGDSNSDSASASIASASQLIASLQAGKLEKYPTITSDSDGHTVTDADNDKLFLLDSSGGAFAIELPTGVQVGTSVGFLLETAGSDVTFQSTSGATINSKDSSVILNIATGYVSATCIATDTWWIAGDLL